MEECGLCRSPAVHSGSLQSCNRSWDSMNRVKLGRASRYPPAAFAKAKTNRFEFNADFVPK